MKGNSNERPPFPGYSLEEENPVLEGLLAHRSIRKYKDRPIPLEALDRILEAAQRAPTSSNCQSYSIIIVDDRGVREKLRDLSDRSIRQRYVADCGVLLVFCADISRLIYICEKKGYHFRGDQLNTLLVAHGDALIACQNAALAAESMGFGTCMVGNVRNQPQAVSDLLELPQYVFATVGLAIGYPDEDTGLKPRLPRQVVVSRNQYATSHMQEGLAEYDRIMCQSGIYCGRMHPLDEVDPDLKETFTEETYGWQEHIARQLCRSSLDKRRGLAMFLEHKGFTCR